MVVPDHAGLYVLAACLLLSLGLIAVGIFRLVRGVLGFVRHVEGYGDLPLWKVLEVTEARVGFALGRFDTLPSLITRIETALTELAIARDRLRAGLASVSSTLGAIGSLFGGRSKRTARPATAGRTRGN